MSCQRRLRSLGLPSLGKRRPRGDLIALCNFLGTGRGEGGAELFSLGSSDRAGGNGSELSPGEVQAGHEGSISLLRGWSNPGTSFLERCSMPQAGQCLRGIWTMPLTTCFNFWSAAKSSGSWTRWLWQVSSKWNIIFCSILFWYCTKKTEVRCWYFFIQLYLWGKFTLRVTASPSVKLTHLVNEVYYRSKYNLSFCLLQELIKITYFSIFCYATSLCYGTCFHASNKVIISFTKC